MEFIKFGCRVQLLKQIEIVIGSSAVRPKTYSNTGAQHLRHARNAACKLHIALRIMSNPDASSLEQIYLFVICINHVSGYQPVAQKTELFKMLNRTRSIAL